MKSQADTTKSEEHNMESVSDEVFDGHLSIGQVFNEIAGKHGLQLDEMLEQMFRAGRELVPQRRISDVESETSEMFARRKQERPKLQFGSLGDSNATSNSVNDQDPSAPPRPSEPQLETDSRTPIGQADRDINIVVANAEDGKILGYTYASLLVKDNIRLPENQVFEPQSIDFAKYLEFMEQDCDCFRSDEIYLAPAAHRRRCQTQNQLCVALKECVGNVLRLEVSL